MIKKHMSAIYDWLINKNVAVASLYELSKYRHPKIYKYFRWILWIYLLFLIVKYSLFKVPFINGNAGKSAFELYPNKDKVIKKLRKVDIISFDIFDTLILRQVSSPVEVFDVVGQKLGISGYRIKRIFAENESKRRNDSGEATLSEICSLIEEMYGINAKAAYAAELEVERTVCFANPYFKELLENIDTKDKKIIAVSDMYLPSDYLKELLQICGFNIGEVIVSCEAGCSKHSGKLWKNIKNRYKGKKIIHIGDNYISDLKMCMKNGIDCCPVPNVSQLYKSYNDCGVYSMTMSLYYSLVNVKTYDLNDELTAHYKFGYVYGGILSYGYCQWLERIAKEQEYDLLLFTARDSKVFYDIYRKHFGSVRAEYLYISRMGAVKCTVEQNFDIFLDVMFCSKSHRKNKVTISEALCQAELAFLNDSLGEYGISGKDLLCQENLNELYGFLIKNKSKVIEAYAADKIAFDRYIKPIIGSAKKVCVIDIGWRGTVYTLLDSYFKENKYNVDIEGAMVGSIPQNHVINYMETEKIKSYSFSYKDNTNLIVSDEKDLAVIEMLFSNSQPSVTGYKTDKDGVAGPEFGKPEGNNEKYFSDIHRGIYEFCSDWVNICGRIGYNAEIGGAEALSPLYKICHNKNIKYLFSDIKMSLEPNADSEKII